MKLILCVVSLGMVGVALTACSGGGNHENAIEQTSASSEPLSSGLPLPQGLTCGLWYHDTSSWNESGDGDPFCDGSYDWEGYVPPGYNFVFAGDMKRPANQGWYNSTLISTTAPGRTYSSDRLPLPRGTTCGFKHSRNDPTQTCLGYDSAVSCPYGWTQRVANDEGSSDSWSWCEFEDLSGTCLNGVCRGNVPLGTACGVSHNGPKGAWGLCENTVAGPGMARTECPTGWSSTSPADLGAPLGVGIQFCYRSQ
jgi:hypothetical protein